MAMIISHLSQSFTRPSNTTAYADGDLVANSVTAGSVTPLRFVLPQRPSCKIVGASIRKSDETDVTNADFTLHLYRSSPTVANGDNGALSTDYASKIGTYDFATMVAYTDDAYIMSTGGDFYVGAQSVYGLLEADAAYSPASAEVFTVTLDIGQE